MKIQRRGFLAALFAAPVVMKAAPGLMTLPKGERIIPRVIKEVGALRPIGLHDTSHARIIRTLDGPSSLEFTTTETFTCGQMVRLSIVDETFIGAVKRIETELSNEYGAMQHVHRVYCDNELPSVVNTHVYIDHRVNSEELARAVGDAMLKQFRHRNA